MKRLTDRERLAYAMADDVDTVSLEELEAASSILGRTARDTRQGRCPCGEHLSAHEKTTGRGDCFGCRAARRKGGAR